MLHGVKEEWRSAMAGYEVSSQGRVRSVDRVVMTIRGPRHYRGKELSPYIDAAGYPRVTIGHHSWKVATLVATVFLGPRPEGQEVRHLNGVKTDSSLPNLVYGTSHENKLDMLRLGEHHWARRSHCSKGHELSGDNLKQVKGQTRRICRTCDRERNVALRERRGGQRRQPRPAPADLRRMYVDEGLSAAKIAARIGRDRTAVRKWLIADGVELRSLSDAAAHRGF